MSLQEVVELARELPRAEQLELVEMLGLTPDDPSPEMLKLLPAGFVAEYFPVEVATESWKVVDQFLQTQKESSR